MEVEDVIELGSSDEESEVPPRKKMKAVENAMVHIPTKIHGVTIKPVKVNSTNTQKLFSGKNITVTKLPKPGVPAQAIGARQIKTPNKPAQKPQKGVMKKKVAVKSNIVPKRIMPMVINPLNHVKKTASQSFVSCGVTKLQNPIPIASLPALNKLPPSVTIKKTGTMLKASGNTVNIPKVVPKHTNTIKKRKIPKVVHTVELDDEEPQQSSNCPQWYVRPEDQTKADDSSTQENVNNKEPEKPTYIEITIEDSPIKPPKTKRARELSIETVVTIEDSPNKDGTTNAYLDGVSDDEPDTRKKVPHSKKKLEYEHKLKRIEEIRTFEIEIDPIAINISATEKEDKIVTLTPNIIEVEESAVEIAENQQGDVSVIVEVGESTAETTQNQQGAKPADQVKPAQSTEVAEPSIVGNENNEDEFSSTYLSFINLCLELENSDDMKKIVEKKIKTYYRQVPKEYTESEEFIDMVSSKVSAIKAAPEKMYLYIKDIVDELNLQRKLAKQMPVLNEKPKEPETFSLGKDGDFDPSKQRQVRKLERTLKKLNRAIHKLEMQEVDFDDDEDSVYLLTEKYKEKMVRVHAKFCQLTNSKMPSEPRLVIDPRPGLAPGPAKRLEAWINRNNSLTFPDFHDVLRCVKEANIEDKLEWTDAFIMEEARDLFIRCGKKLQRRRQEKEWRIATSRVTLTEDPAEQSSELKKRLEDNRRVASTKENEVINMYSDRQNQLKLEAVDINDKEAEESPDESEEDEKDESLSLESKQRRKERLKRLLQEQSKKNSTKNPQVTDTISNEKTVSDIKPDDNKADTAHNQTTYDDNSIQSLSDDDSNDIGSDVDELHLLQKLHSDHDRRSNSSPESSDSETPIAISDTLDSSSDESNKVIQEKPGDIISIENSSYSDESDSQQSNAKTNKRTIIIEEIDEESVEIECSSEIIAKDTCLANAAIEDVLLTSPDTESNASRLMSSENTKSVKDTCLTKEAVEDVLLTSPDTESNPSRLLSSENTKSGKDTCLTKGAVEDVLLTSPDTESNPSRLLSSENTKSRKDTCLTKEAVEDVLLTSPNTESHASRLLSSLDTKSEKDTCVAKAAVEDVLLSSPNTESNASGLLSFEDTKYEKDIKSSEKDIKSSENCLQERMKNTSGDLSIQSKSTVMYTDTNNIGISNHLDKNSRDESIKSNLLDTNTDFQVTSINNSDLVPKSNLESLATDSNIQDNLVAQSVNDILHSDNPEDGEEPTINSISQAPTINESEFSLTPFSMDLCMDVSMLTSKSISFNPNDISAAPSGKLLENETLKETFLGIGMESKEPTGSEAFQSGDVCIEAEMGSEILISNVVSIRKPDLTDETLKENLNPNQDLDDSTILDSGSQMISNGSSNEDSSEMLQLVNKNESSDLDLQENTIVTEKPTQEQAVDCVEKKLEVQFDVK